MSFFKSRRFLLSSLMVSMGLSVPLAPVWAQPFPSKPVRIVIGFPPGGGIDIVARTIAPKLSEALGQPVIIDNKPGVAGVLGTNLVAKAPADGHTIFFGTTGNISINPAFMPNLPFNMDKDFTPLMLVASLPFLVYAHPSVPVKSLSELVAYAKANPGKVNWASSGNGGSTHLAIILAAQQAGIKVTHVPYKGAGPSTTAVLAGEADLQFVNVGPVASHLKAGKLRAIGVASLTRLPVLPDLPTMHESGFPGFQAATYYGLLAPAATPRPIINRMHAELVKIVRSAEFTEKFAELGVIPVGSSPEQFADMLREDVAKWSKIVKEHNIKPD
jgi:tripartite-type tricarboxylate transporter receptor subunit TctC